MRTDRKALPYDINLIRPENYAFKGAIIWAQYSLGVWQAQSRAGVYAEASAIVYALRQSRGVTAIAKIAGGLVLLRM
jgi:hypothetical protein